MYCIVHPSVHSFDSYFSQLNRTSLLCHLLQAALPFASKTKQATLRSRPTLEQRRAVVQVGFPNLKPDVSQMREVSAL